MERCQIIAEDMVFRHRETGEVKKRTAQEVYNSSPTGELMFVQFWFLECVFKREAWERLHNGEDPEAVAQDMDDRYKRMMPPTYNQVCLEYEKKTPTKPEQK